MMRIAYSVVGMCVGLSLLSGCGHAGQENLPPKLVIQPVSFKELPGWDAGDTQQGGLLAFRESCSVMVKQPSGKLMSREAGLQAGTIADWKKPCESAMSVNPSQAKSYFESHFQPVRITDNDNPQGLFTGYYEASLKGSSVRNDTYRYPVYKLPPNLERHNSAPYFSRQEIENGRLRGLGLEIMFVNDPVELFFLHVQGSGRISLEDGSTTRLTYAGKNGHPYKSIGAYLVQQGVFTKEELTAPVLKEWLRNNPDRADEVMQQNPSYIFFREVDQEPRGAEGSQLTPEHSLAVDKNIIPYGVPLWVATTLPVEENGNLQAYKRLMIAQDTGSAIQGIVRGDVFFGAGEHAELLAGLMKQPGSYYALLPKTIPLPAEEEE